MVFLQEEEKQKTLYCINFRLIGIRILTVHHSSEIECQFNDIIFSLKGQSNDIFDLIFSTLERTWAILTNRLTYVLFYFG